MLHDCHVVIHERLRHGVRDLDQRIADLRELLAADTPWERRRTLLDKYDIKWFLVSRMTGPVEWVRGHFRQQLKGPGYVLFELVTE
jgi:hypothetical protein